MAKLPTKKEEYVAWQDIYSFCVQAKQPIENNWRRWYSIADDNLWGGARNTDGSSAIEVNELGSIIETIIPNIILHPGKVEIRAINEEDIYKAVIYEYLGKYILSHSDIKQQFLKCVYDTLVLGDSLVKIGYWNLPLVRDNQFKAGLAGDTTSSAFALHLPLFEFLPDYHVNDWSLQRFYIHEVKKHIDEFIDNDTYDQKQVDKLKPSFTERDVYNPTNNMLSSKKEYIQVQEIHNLVKGEMYVAAYTNNAEGFLLQTQETYPFTPFEKLSFFPRPMSIWGTSVSQRIEKHLVELSRYHSGLSSIMRKIGVFKTMFDSTKIKPEVIKLLKTANDEALPIVGPPAGAIETVDLGVSGRQFVFDQAINIKETTIRSMSGVTQQEMGVAETGVDTAFEVNTLKSASDIKNQMRLNTFEAFAKRVIEKLIYIVSVEYTPDRISQMTGIDSNVIEQLIEPYNPGKYILEYGDSAANSNKERMNKLQWLLQSPLAGAINPSYALRLASDALGLEFSDEMILPGGLIGGGQGQQQTVQSGVSTPGNRQQESSGVNNSQTTRRSM